MTWSLLNHHLADSVITLLDQANEGNENREAMEHRAMSREQAANIIHAVLWAYSSRSSDFAGAYAMRAFQHSVGEKLTDWLVKSFEFDARVASHHVATTPAEPGS
jgi:hypothetical protein